VSTRALFDVNALFAMFDPEHTFHLQVRAWWDASEEGGWATCPITQNGFARIMSQPHYTNPAATMDAIRLLAMGLEQSGHEFWPDDISITDESLFDRSYILGPNQITDVYLLALAVKNGGRLVTFDRGVPLRAVRGAEARNLVVL
jgi:toxin-antitoxin system PIN domain toxin